jgi:hypothetical protein
MSECPPVAGAVIRPLVEPVPVYPWAMVHRRSLRHPALTALTSVLGELAANEEWRRLPADAWLPSADARWAPGPPSV